jgi:hypothetical protein
MQCFSTAVEDECGICDGDNSTCSDCAGVPNGSSYFDMCANCDDDPLNDCVQDCVGDWGGNAVVDVCGLCNGGNTECAAVISNIDDIPADQGGRVYVTFDKSPADTNEPNRIEGYQLERLDNDEWVGVEFYAAYSEDYYILEATTLIDSTSQDNAITIFRVIASMDEGIWISEEESGYSVDNISPGAPQQFAGEYTDDEVQLSWSVYSPANC